MGNKYMNLFSRHFFMTISFGLIMTQFSTLSEAGSDKKINSVSQLIKASGLDQISVLSVIQARFPNEENRDATYAKFCSCILSSDGAAFSKIFAVALAEKMSNENIAKAVAFYESPLGEKFVRRQIVASYLSLGIPTDQKVEELSNEETAKAETFLETEAGKLLEMRNILLLPSVLDSFIKVQGELGKSCL